MTTSPPQTQQVIPEVNGLTIRCQVNVMVHQCCFLSSYKSEIKANDVCIEQRIKTINAPL